VFRWRYSRGQAFRTVLNFAALAANILLVSRLFNSGRTVLWRADYIRTCDGRAFRPTVTPVPPDANAYRRRSLLPAPTPYANAPVLRQRRWFDNVDGGNSGGGSPCIFVRYRLRTRFPARNLRFLCHGWVYSSSFAGIIRVTHYSPPRTAFSITGPVFCNIVRQRSR